MTVSPRGIRSPIPAGNLIGRSRGKGTGAASLVPITDIAQSLQATGAILPPGAPSPLMPIATHTILANPTGSTAAPIATTTPDSSSITWAYGATTLTASISATYAGQTSIKTLYHLNTDTTAGVDNAFTHSVTISGDTNLGLAITPTSGAAGKAILEMDSIGAGNNCYIEMLHARGTVGSLSAVQTGDQMAFFQFAGWGSTVPVNSAYIAVFAAENFDDTHSAAIFTIATVDTSAETNLTRIAVTGAGTTQIQNGDLEVVTGKIVVGSAICPPSNPTMSTPANPTGRSGAAVMMGLAGTITPNSAAGSGNVLITVCGDCFNTTAIADGGTIQIRTGTGTAPTNAAAVTGTARGAAITFIQATTADKYPFSITALATGLTLGTAVWIDVSLASVTGGTATIENVTIVAVEV